MCSTSVQARYLCLLLLLITTKGCFIDVSGIEKLMDGTTPNLLQQSPSVFSNALELDTLCVQYCSYLVDPASSHMLV